MPLFVCDVCGAIENTALGFFWSRKRVQWKDKSKNGKALCSECMPDQEANGEPNPRGGVWHGQFPKDIATEARLKEIGLHHFEYFGKKFEHLKLRR